MLSRTLEQKTRRRLTHWCSHKLAAKFGDVSVSAVQRVCRKQGIKLPQLERHMVSNDPDFEAKAVDVIGLYLTPPARLATATTS